MRIAPMLACLCLGSLAHAQASGAEGAPSKAARRLEKALGDPVRVVGDEGTVEGRLLDLGAQSLTLDVGFEYPPGPCTDLCLLGCAGSWPSA